MLPQREVLLRNSQTIHRFKFLRQDIVNQLQIWLQLMRIFLKCQRQARSCKRRSRIRILRG